MSCVNAETKKCPFCGSVNNARFDYSTMDCLGGSYCLMRCEECETRYLHPSPSAELLAAFYGADYYGHASAKFVGVVERLENWIRTDRAIFVHSMASGKGVVVDVGCGNGQFISLLSQMGYAAIGIEPEGGSYERASIIDGIRVIRGDATMLAEIQGSVDIITMWHVFEHLPDPQIITALVGEKLKKGGLFFISLPNIESLQAKIFRGNWLALDPPRHIFLPTKKALIGCMKKHGFVLVCQRNREFDQAIAGTVFSILNLVSPKDMFFNWIKKKNNPTGIITMLVSCSAVIVVLPFALLINIFELIIHSPASLELVFRKE